MRRFDGNSLTGRSVLVSAVMGVMVAAIICQPSRAGRRRFRCRNTARACCCPQPRIRYGAVPDATAVGARKQSEKSAAVWKPLFDGQTLSKWKVVAFGGDGEVVVDDGQVNMGAGVSLTGITYQGDLPKIDYEVELEAMRVDGIDFFCGLTFPVNESSCSLIVGGWAGSTVGLSNIDDRDASDNDTTRLIDFDSRRWYRIRVRVTTTRIEAWIDDKQVVNQELAGRKISIRPEVELSTPLGISAWQTEAALRNIRLRKLR